MIEKLIILFLALAVVVFWRLAKDAGRDLDQALEMLDSRDNNSIHLTAAEIQSGHDRVRWAEGLIRQLPEDHDGRNSWLMNYGRGDYPRAPLAPAPRHGDNYGGGIGGA